MASVDTFRGMWQYLWARTRLGHCVLMHFPAVPERSRRLIARKNVSFLVEIVRSILDLQEISTLGLQPGTVVR